MFSIKFNRKSQTSSSAVIWIGLIVAVIIVVSFFLFKINPSHIDFELQNIDLEAIQSRLNLACNSYFFESNYNPVTEKGMLIIYNDKICINDTIQTCRMSLCDTDVNHNFNLSEIIEIKILKKEGGDDIEISIV